MDDKYTKEYCLHIRLEELLKEKGISRAKLCKDLDLQRTNLNRYYRNQAQRLDISDLWEIRKKSTSFQ